MNAIIETGGQQFNVKPGDVIEVNRLNLSPNQEFTFDKVLAISDGDDIVLGSPYVEGASVKAKFVNDTKGKKVIVFKMKRRKGYRRKQGHRQTYSEVEVIDISK